MNTHKKINVTAISACTIITFIAILLHFAFIRDIFISFAEIVLKHEFKNSEKQHFLLLKCAEYIFVVFCPLLFLKLFTFWFSTKVHNSCINFIRCTAAFVVYFLHTSIFTQTRGALFTNTYTYLLRLPAWGG